MQVFCVFFVLLRIECVSTSVCASQAEFASSHILSLATSLIQSEFIFAHFTMVQNSNPSEALMVLITHTQTCTHTHARTCTLYLHYGYRLTVNGLVRPLTISLLVQISAPQVIKKNGHT